MPKDLADRQQLEAGLINSIFKIRVRLIGFVMHYRFRQRVIVFRLMWAQRVVKPDELIRNKPEVSFAEENEVVQAFGS